MNTLTPLKQQLQLGFSFVETHEMTSKAQPLNNEFIKQISDIFFQAGRAFESVESQRQVFESGNLALQDAIQEIKKAHLKDLNGVVDAWEAKTIAIVQKLTMIVERIRIYSSTPKYCGAYPIDTTPLQALIDSVPALDYETLRKYPEIQITQDMPQEDFLVLEEFILQTHPLIQGLMESRKQEMEQLTKEVKSLKSAKCALLNEKKTILEFHERFMERLHDEVIEKLDSAKMMKTAHTRLSSIKWTVPKTSRAECKNCGVRADLMSSDKAERVHEYAQKMNINELGSLNEWVTNIWASISTEKLA